MGGWVQIKLDFFGNSSQNSSIIPALEILVSISVFFFVKVVSH